MCRQRKQGKGTEHDGWRDRWCGTVLYWVVKQDFSDEVTSERGKGVSHRSLSILGRENRGCEGFEVGTFVVCQVVPGRPEW